MDLQPQPGKRTVKASAPRETPGDRRLIREVGKNDGFALPPPPLPPPAFFLEGMCVFFPLSTAVSPQPGKGVGKSRLWMPG